jgi:hypothetical protein
MCIRPSSPTAVESEPTTTRGPARRLDSRYLTCLCSLCFPARRERAGVDGPVVQVRVRQPASERRGPSIDVLVVVDPPRERQASMVAGMDLQRSCRCHQNRVAASSGSGLDNGQGNGEADLPWMDARRSHSLVGVEQEWEEGRGEASRQRSTRLV